MKYKYPAGHIRRKKDDIEELKAIQEEILSRRELSNVDAVRNNRVYVFDWYSTCGGAQYFLCLAQMAKWLYPGQLKDLHPRKVYARYLKEFQGLDIDLDVYGVFFILFIVYPSIFMTVELFCRPMSDFPGLDMQK